MLWQLFFSVLRVFCAVLKAVEHGGGRGVPHFPALHDRFKLELRNILAAVLRIAPLNFLAAQNAVDGFRQRVGILLACTGAIKDDILDVETLGCKLMELLSVQAPQTIVDRYSVSIPEEECDFLGYELLQQAGKRRGFLLRGGEIDTERMARILLDEFRGGVLGRITLEMPAAAE